MVVEIVERARIHGGRAAIDEGPGGARATHAQLVSRAEAVAAALLDGAPDLDGARVAYLVPSGVDSVATLWGIWLAGGIAVPMALSHPRPELEHVAQDAEPVAIVVDPSLADRVRELGPRVLPTDAIPSGATPLPDVAGDRAALIVYTSGSTGRPKGAVWTHQALVHQVRTLVRAWRWQPDDVALLLLPLHHVHGLVNVVTCGLWTGASIRVMRDFDAAAVWEAMADLTVLMAVPTIYHRLIASHERLDAGARQRGSAAAQDLRLMVSGSAALPVSVLERWRELTGHTLLERYGMTEIGMALGNPYDGPRLPGTVGRPFPGVEVRVVDEAFVDVPDGEDGQLLVRGPGMFTEYWRRPDATAAAFHEGWFTTGDMVSRDADGVFRIRGRLSVDIIKTGGYKVSALEIEEVLRSHAAIADCAVVGLPDEEWGEVVAAALVMADGGPAHAGGGGGVLPGGEEQLQQWMRDRLAPYKVPRRIRTVDALPRNALGKVVKPRVRGEVFDG